MSAPGPKLAQNSVHAAGGSDTASLASLDSQEVTLLTTLSMAGRHSARLADSSGLVEGYARRRVSLGDRLHNEPCLLMLAHQLGLGRAKVHSTDRTFLLSEHVSITSTTISTLIEACFAKECGKHARPELRSSCLRHALREEAPRRGSAETVAVKQSPSPAGQTPVLTH
jgi:hypothetical protein